MVFEIHITGNKRILEVGKLLGVKTISIDLLRPDFSVLTTEYMTSIEYKCCDFKEAYAYTTELNRQFWVNFVDVQRVKIECPPYEEYFPKSLYLETHYYDGGQNPESPLSINQNRYKLGLPIEESLLSTERTYDKSKYKEFMKNKTGNHQIFEIALLDTNVGLDSKWFSLYE